MINIAEFNKSYLGSIIDCAGGDIKRAATVLNAELSQIAEILKMRELTVQNVSNSMVALAEPIFTANDLNKTVDIGNQEIISALNQSYLSLIRHLSATNERLAQLATRIQLDMNCRIKKLTDQEIKTIAASNKLMFRFSLPAKSIAKANATVSQKTAGGFLNHIALMTLPVREGALYAAR